MTLTEIDRLADLIAYSSFALIMGAMALQAVRDHRQNERLIAEMKAAYEREGIRLPSTPTPTRKEARG